MALAYIPLENDSSTSLALQRVFRDRLNPIEEHIDSIYDTIQLQNILFFSSGRDFQPS